jgi:hypothetical protein
LEDLGHSAKKLDPPLVGPNPEEAKRRLRREARDQAGQPALDYDVEIDENELEVRAA